MMSGKPSIASAPLRLLLVLALLLTQAPLLPAMILGAAALDGSHQVECGSDVDGMTLRLGHRPEAVRNTETAAHSCLLRIFVREAGEEEDHQFRFTPPSDAVQDAGGRAATVETGDGPATFLPALGAVLLRQAAPAPRIGNPCFASDDTVPPALDRLRTVVMRA
jgi:hypothetical protein